MDQAKISILSNRVLPVWGWSWWTWCCRQISSGGCVWSTSLYWPTGNQTYVTVPRDSVAVVVIAYLAARLNHTVALKGILPTAALLWAGVQYQELGLFSLLPRPFLDDLIISDQSFGALLRFPRPKEPMHSHFTCTSKLLRLILWPFSWRENVPLDSRGKIQNDILNKRQEFPQTQCIYLGLADISDRLVTSFNGI